MADTGTSGRVTWKVTSQQETVQPSPLGPLSKGFNIFFQTDNGLSGSVFVPEAQYSEQMAAQLIGDKVAAMTRVQRLGGSV